MELQLGLSLPSNTIKGFDLNSYGYEPIEVLGSDPLSHLDRCSSNKDTTNNYTESKKKKKRCFDHEAFEHDLNVVVPQTLPLAFWNNHPNGNEEGCLKELDNNSFVTANKNIDEDGVVGWPPIRSWRKKFCYDQNQGGLAARNNQTAENGTGGGSKYKYVKVKMEGVAIARKVDLSIHNCYQTLTDTLIGMFGKCHENNLKDYKVTYQDKEGDWLLAGDIPWGTFIKSVQRLKLLRGSN